MKNKKLFISMIALLSVLIALATFIVIWFWGDTYPDFNDFRESVEIPGLKEGFVPQGITSFTGDWTTEDEDGKKTTVSEDYFFISGYTKDSTARIYVTGNSVGYIGYVTLQNTDGTAFDGHCGGIAVNNDGTTLWVASDGRVYVAKNSGTAPAKTCIAYELIERAQRPSGENTFAFTASFAANGNASFCYYYDAPDSSLDKLYVGEFYRPGNYETAEDHHITTKVAEEKHNAFVYEYSVSNNTSNIYGLTTLSDTSKLTAENQVPRIDYIYSVPAEIQGFARTEKGVVLSSSWGLKNSTLYYYDWSKVHPSSGSSNRSDFKDLTSDGHSFTYEEIKTKFGNDYTEDPNSKYVYHIDSSALIKKYSIPSMSEGLCLLNGRVHVLFESACYKYKPFVRKRIANVYSFIPRG